MVDIADGIGMVSKVKNIRNSLILCPIGESTQSHMTPFQGIEALEYYIDPSAEAQVEETAKKPEEPGAATDGSTPTVIAGQPVAPVSPDQPAVFCQKGDFSFFFYFSTCVLCREMLSVRPKQSERCESRGKAGHDHPSSSNNLAKESKSYSATSKRSKPSSERPQGSDITCAKGSES